MQQPLSLENKESIDSLTDIQHLCLKSDMGDCTCLKNDYDSKDSFFSLAGMDLPVELFRELYKCDSPGAKGLTPSNTMDWNSSSRDFVSDFIRGQGDNSTSIDELGFFPDLDYDSLFPNENSGHVFDGTMAENEAACFSDNVPSLACVEDVTNLTDLNIELKFDAERKTLCSKLNKPEKDSALEQQQIRREMSPYKPTKQTKLRIKSQRSKVCDRAFFANAVTGDLPHTETGKAHQSSIPETVLPSVIAHPNQNECENITAAATDLSAPTLSAELQADGMNTTLPFDDEVFLEHFKNLDKFGSVLPHDIFTSENIREEPSVTDNNTYAPKTITSLSPAGINDTEADDGRQSDIGKNVKKRGRKKSTVQRDKKNDKSSKDNKKDYSTKYKKKGNSTKGQKKDNSTKKEIKKVDSTKLKEKRYHPKTATNIGCKIPSQILYIRKSNLIGQPQVLDLNDLVYQPAESSFGVVNNHGLGPCNAAVLVQPAAASVYQHSCGTDTHMSDVIGQCGTVTEELSQFFPNIEELLVGRNIDCSTFLDDSKEEISSCDFTQIMNKETFSAVRHAGTFGKDAERMLQSVNVFNNCSVQGEVDDRLCKVSMKDTNSATDTTINCHTAVADLANKVIGHAEIHNLSVSDDYQGESCSCAQFEKVSVGKTIYDVQSEKIDFDSVREELSKVDRIFCPLDFSTDVCVEKEPNEKIVSETHDLNSQSYSVDQMKESEIGLQSYVKYDSTQSQLWSIEADHFTSGNSQIGQGVFQPSENVMDCNTIHFECSSLSEDSFLIKNIPSVDNSNSNLYASVLSKGQSVDHLKDHESQPDNHLCLCLCIPSQIQNKCYCVKGAQSASTDKNDEMGSADGDGSFDQLLQALDYLSTYTAASDSNAMHVQPMPDSGQTVEAFHQNLDSKNVRQAPEGVSTEDSWEKSSGQLYPNDNVGHLGKEGPFPLLSDFLSSPCHYTTVSGSDITCDSSVSDNRPVANILTKDAFPVLGNKTAFDGPITNNQMDCPALCISQNVTASVPVDAPYDITGHSYSMAFPCTSSFLANDTYPSLQSPVTSFDASALSFHLPELCSAYEQHDVKVPHSSGVLSSPFHLLPATDGTVCHSNNTDLTSEYVPPNFFPSDINCVPPTSSYYQAPFTVNSSVSKIPQNFLITAGHSMHSSSLLTSTSPTTSLDVLFTSGGSAYDHQSTSVSFTQLPMTINSSQHIIPHVQMNACNLQHPFNLTSEPTVLSAQNTATIFNGTPQMDTSASAQTCPNPVCKSGTNVQSFLPAPETRSPLLPFNSATATVSDHKNLMSSANNLFAINSLLMPSSSTYEVPVSFPLNSSHQTFGSLSSLPPTTCANGGANCLESFPLFSTSERPHHLSATLSRDSVSLLDLWAPKETPATALISVPALVPSVGYQPCCPCHPIPRPDTQGLPSASLDPSTGNYFHKKAEPTPLLCSDDLPQNIVCIDKDVYRFAPSAADIHTAHANKQRNLPPEARLPLKPRTCQVKQISIGTYLFSVSDEKHSKESSVSFSYQKKKLRYCMVFNGLVNENSSRTEDPLPTVIAEIDFDHITGLWGKGKHLLLEVSQAPCMFLASHNPSVFRCKSICPIDVTGGQMQKSPYHFLTFQKEVTASLKRELCSDPSLCDLISLSVTVDPNKSLAHDHPSGTYEQAD